MVVRLDEFHKADRVDDPDAPVSGKEIVERLEHVESFLGLAALKASAPQYQQGDFFEGVRKATRSFVAECAADSTSWRAALSRYRGDNQVPLLTITKSKGLEYDLVVLLGLDDEQWWSFTRNPHEGHATFFVAASRARERLFMTLCEGKPRGKLGDVYKLLAEAGVKGRKSEGLLGRPMA